VLAEERQLSCPTRGDKLLQEELSEQRESMRTGRNSPVRRARSPPSEMPPPKAIMRTVGGTETQCGGRHRIAGAPQARAQIMLVSISSFARDGSIFTTFFQRTSTPWVKLGWPRDATSSETLLCPAKIESNKAPNAVRGISVAS
jgi:hypothetical protein